MKRVLVCGGRDYNDSLRVIAVLDRVHRLRTISCVIHGNAKGADTCAALWAEMRSVDALAFPAQWDLYGKRAGFLRNTQMLDEGLPDAVIAFPGGVGTAMMVKISEDRGIPVMRP